MRAKTTIHLFKAALSIFKRQNQREYFSEMERQKLVIY